MDHLRNNPIQRILLKSLWHITYIGLMVVMRENS